jgi:hypothetical protein
MLKLDKPTKGKHLKALEKVMSFIEAQWEEAEG